MAEKKKIKNEASSSNSAMENNSRGVSVVVDVGRRRSSCGYCRSAGHTSISHGLWAHSLTVDDYQALLDKGWRRSGCFLYKPEMERTCCPSYTIRLKASEFVPSKDQRRVDKRLQRYLALQNLSSEVVSNKSVTFRFLEGALDVKKTENLGDEFNTSKECSSSSQNNDARCMEMDSLSERPENKSNDELLMDQLTQVLNTAVQACFGNGEISCNLQLPKASVKKVAPSKKKLLVEGSEELLFSSNISFGMASALRRANKDVLCNKILQDNMEVNNLTPNVIAEVLVRHLIEMGESRGLLIRSCNGHINFYSTSSVACVDDKVRTKTRSHERPTDSGMKESRPNGKSQIPIVIKRRLEIRLRRSIYDPEEYALYRKYQLRVHNDAPDRVTESSYRRFLVDTPLVFVSPTGDGTVPPCGFGSFHQQYFIDGQLIAVGVIDILPKCVSSKYLFWDPDFAILSLGKFSALEEIRLVKENQVHCPSLQYYYLGYYIHSCNKMRYKASYRPSELLCPLRYQWVAFDIAKPLLDRKRYVVLSDFSTQDGQPLLPNMLENNMEDQHEDVFHDGKNDMFVHEDEEMVEDDSEDSDDDSDQESGLVSSTSKEVDDGYLGEVLIGLRSGRLRYKELRQAFGNSERKYLENQLQRYVKAVGLELSQRMVYSSN